MQKLLLRTRGTVYTSALVLLSNRRMAERRREGAAGQRVSSDQNEILCVPRGRSNALAFSKWS